MRKYVIATHGKMAEGIRSTLEIIVGPQENLICINGYTEECPEPVSEMKRIVEESPEEEVVFMTDMLGGSINNNASGKGSCGDWNQSGGSDFAGDVRAGPGHGRGGERGRGKFQGDDGLLQ